MSLLYLGLSSALEVSLTSREDQRLSPPFLTLIIDRFPFLIFIIFKQSMTFPPSPPSSDSFKAQHVWASSPHFLV